VGCGRNDGPSPSHPSHSAFARLAGCQAAPSDRSWRRIEPATLYLLVLSLVESSGLITSVKLHHYIKRFSSTQERAKFALSVGTTLGHFNNVAYGQRVPSAALTRQIALGSGREVPEWELRPHDWHLIWPELIGAEGAPAVPVAQNAEAA